MSKKEREELVLNSLKTISDLNNKLYSKLTKTQKELFYKLFSGGMLCFEYGPIYDSFEKSKRIYTKTYKVSNFNTKNLDLISLGKCSKIVTLFELSRKNGLVLDEITSFRDKIVNMFNDKMEFQSQAVITDTPVNLIHIIGFY